MTLTNSIYTGIIGIDDYPLKNIQQKNRSFGQITLAVSVSIS